MTPTWFNARTRRTALATTAERWLGTPFFANSAAPGPDGGVDCVRLLHAVYHECGVVPELAIPRSVMDHGQHATTSPLLDYFTTGPAAPYFARLPDCLPENILPGDALCFRAGHVPHHAGLVITPDDFLHVLAPAGVHLTRLRAAYRGAKILGRLEAVFRPAP